MIFSMSTDIMSGGEPVAMVEEDHSRLASISRRLVAAFALSAAIAVGPGTIASAEPVVQSESDVSSEITQPVEQPVESGSHGEGFDSARGPIALLSGIGGMGLIFCLTRRRTLAASPDGFKGEASGND